MNISPIGCGSAGESEEDMKILKYEVQGLGICSIMEQAKHAAMERARATGAPVIITAYCDNGKAPKVQFNPDGTFEKL